MEPLDDRLNDDNKFHVTNILEKSFQNLDPFKTKAVTLAKKKQNPNILFSTL